MEIGEARQTDRQPGKHTGADRQKDQHPDRQTGRPTNRQKHRVTDRQADRETARTERQAGKRHRLENITVHNIHLKLPTISRCTHY